MLNEMDLLEMLMEDLGEAFWLRQEAPEGAKERAKGLGLPELETLMRRILERLETTMVPADGNVEMLATPMAVRNRAEYMATAARYALFSSGRFPYDLPILDEVWESQRAFDALIAQNLKNM